MREAVGSDIILVSPVGLVGLVPVPQGGSGLAAWSFPVGRCMVAGDRARPVPTCVVASRGLVASVFFAYRTAR